MMRFIKLLGIFSLLIVFSLFTLHTSSASAQNNQGFVKGQVLVKFRENTPKELRENELKKQKARQINQLENINVTVISVPEKAEKRIIASMMKNSHVEYAEPDYLLEVLMPVNDTYFSSYQWGLENTGQAIVGSLGIVDADIDASSGWDIATGSGIRIAVLDTGIDQDHEDLALKLIDNINFTDSAAVDDFYGHGTHVSGIIAAVTDNSMGVAAVCPACLLMNVKVLNDQGIGATSWVANGIRYAADHGAKVINMSLGSSQKSRTLENAVNYAWKKGVVLAGAAGNSNNPSKTYPGAYTNVIAVAAVNNKDLKASFSSYSSSWVDVAAPGENIFSTFPNHSFYLGTKYGRSLNYDFASGTSMATPMTAGVAGLLWSSPYGTSASLVRSRIESTAERISGTGTYWSKGRINAAKALSP